MYQKSTKISTLVIRALIKLHMSENSRYLSFRLYSNIIDEHIKTHNNQIDYLLILLLNHRMKIALKLFFPPILYHHQYMKCNNFRYAAHNPSIWEYFMVIFAVLTRNFGLKLNKFTVQLLYLGNYHERRAR